MSSLLRVPLTSRRDTTLSIRLGKLELLDLVVGADDDFAFGGDVVADDLEILQLRVVVRVTDDIGVDRRIASGRLAPLQMVERDFGVGQIGMQLDGRRGRSVALLKRNFDRNDAMHDVIDVQPELRAVCLVELRDDLHRRLLAGVRAEKTLADDLGGNAVDEQVAFGIERRYRSDRDRA